MLVSCGDKNPSPPPAPTPTPAKTMTEDTKAAVPEEDASAGKENSAAETSPTATDTPMAASANTMESAANQTPATAPVAESQADGNSDQEAMLSLARKSGCLACHAINKKVVGPAWIVVSQRYKSNPDIRERLINKVKGGGRGAWTEIVGNVAMPPYSPRVSDENIAKLVDFVLGLAK